MIGAEAKQKLFFTDFGSTLLFLMRIISVSSESTAMTAEKR